MIQLLPMSLGGKSLISINDYSKDEWLQILRSAQKFEKSPNQNILAGKVIACLFFEPSTRTRLSFETAVQRLGGSVIGFSDVNSTSGKKGESLKDTVRVVSKYADLIVIRHPLEGSARLASEYADVPIINAGDGDNQHPTQTLLDLYSIEQTQNKLANLKVAFLADLKYSRTVHSLVRALNRFNNSYVFVSPPQLKIPASLRFELDDKKIAYEETTNVKNALSGTDILYANRIQKERFGDLAEYERVKNSLYLSKKILGQVKTKPNLRILNPLPRINEIDPDIDDDPRAYYFKQADNGIYVRQALLAYILGVTT